IRAAIGVGEDEAIERARRKRHLDIGTEPVKQAVGARHEVELGAEAADPGWNTVREIVRRVGRHADAGMGIVGDKHRTRGCSGGPGFLAEDRVAAGGGGHLLAGVVAESAVVGDRAVVIILAVIVTVQEVKQSGRRWRNNWARRRYYRGS